MVTTFTCECAHERHEHYNWRDAERSPCKKCYCPRYRHTDEPPMRPEKCLTCGLPEVRGCICR